ncbi:MAG: CPBP family intramembrane metalloprotease [Chromatiaceae bacterium]
MKETGLFFLYLLACLLLGVLLAYPLMATGWVHEAPHRVMGRLTQAFALLGLWPFLEATGLNSRAALGYDATRARLLRAVWRGWLLGVAILAVLALTEVKLGVRVPETSSAGSVPGLLRKAAQALIGGLLVGLAEETFFRGALFSAIRRRGPVPSAVLWTALLYALLHFMKPGRLPDGAAFDWAASWRMFTEVFTGAFQWKDLDSARRLGVRHSADPVCHRRQPGITLRLPGRKLRRHDRLARSRLDRCPGSRFPISRGPPTRPCAAPGPSE